MFVYLSKKIAIPSGTKLRCLSWNLEQGWIACGGDGGLLKVLALEGAGPDARTAGALASGNLSLNQTLEGHSSAVLCVTWNGVFNKMTSSDENGLIIVWMFSNNSWREEMVNDRKKSFVRDMKWTASGEKICIAYEDGAVIVGGVDGQRLWGKELDLSLASLEWSPDEKYILFSTVAGEVWLYDSSGNAVSKLSLYCNEGYAGAVKVVGMEWYDGMEGYPEPNCPSLAIALDNGRMQIMRHENDDRAICVDTGMKPRRLKWNNNGTVLAVAGSMPSGAGAGEAKELWMVQFYSWAGEHLRTLRVPGTDLRGLSWEGSGLRLALAVDAFIYFANVRPDYRWAYFCDTLVYAFQRPDRPEACVMFWNTVHNERYPKTMKGVLGVAAAADYCTLATKGQSEGAGEYSLIVCNAIGSPVDLRHTDIEPKLLAMNSQTVVVASDAAVYVWQFRSGTSRFVDASSGKAPEGRERSFHIDDRNQEALRQNLKASSAPTSDPITALACSEQLLFVGRASGTVQRYRLPHCQLEGSHQLRCKPAALSINCNATRMSVLDTAGVLTFVDLTARGGAGEHREGERKDVWQMQWSDDDPELFACMEKARMVAIRGQEAEEPVPSTSFLCRFHDLEILAVDLDTVVAAGEAPPTAAVATLQTRSLRDAQKLLASAASGEEAYRFMEAHPHPRLWRSLAQHALEALDLPLADKAFVRCADYQGIQLVKSLGRLGDAAKQRAEVLVHLKRYDEAEEAYRRMGRPDLAIDLRAKLGDWFKVELLLKQSNGSDAALAECWQRIGQYYADRQKWAKAAQYYAQARCSGPLVDCFYALEDFAGIAKVAETLPAGSPLLLSVGDKLQSVGLCDEGVAAFLKAGDTKRAIDCCVLLNQWDAAVRLAEAHNFPQITGLLSRYASHLLEKNKTLEAVELYRKAGQHKEAGKLLRELAQAAAARKVAPLRVKKLHVLAALEVEAFRKRTLEMSPDQATATLLGGGTTLASGATTMAGASTRGTRPPATHAAATLTALMTLDAASAAADDRFMDSAWHGAEAYHFWLLAHRQLYGGNVEAAMRTALHLRNYEDVLDPQDVYAFIALATFYNKFYGQCSKAFVKLEALPALRPDQRDAYAALAVSIFLQHPPVDTRTLKETREKKGASSKGGDPLLEGLQRGKEQVCVASGKQISSDVAYLRCKACKHPMIEVELGGRTTCPLCHSLLPIGGAKVRGAGSGAGYGRMGSVRE